MRTFTAALVSVSVTVLAAEPPKAPGAKDAGPAAKAAEAKRPTPVMSVDGFSTPESVLYDAETDTYLVSNVNGSPLAKDNNGFISELSPEGKLLTLKLIAGGEKGVTLNAPKGTALSKGVLYVADIDTVRLFDRATGAPKGEVKVAGATFVNDLALAEDGRIYVTDSGLKAGKDGAEPSGTDGLYVIEPGAKPKLKTLLKSKDLRRPNGVLVTKDAIVVVTFGANELITLDLSGKKRTGDAVKLPSDSLDGVFLLGDELFVSSWQDTGTIFRGPAAGPFTVFVSDVSAPADIGFDTKRNRVLVPRFSDNKVEAYEVR